MLLSAVEAPCSTNITLHVTQPSIAVYSVQQGLASNLPFLIHHNYSCMPFRSVTSYSALAAPSSFSLAVASLSLERVIGSPAVYKANMCSPQHSERNDSYNHVQYLQAQKLSLGLPPLTTSAPYIRLNCVALPSTSPAANDSSACSSCNKKVASCHKSSVNSIQPGTCGTKLTALTHM